MTGSVGILHTGIRPEEKLIAHAAERQNVPFELIDVRSRVLDPSDPIWSSHSLFLDRCLSAVKGGYVATFLETIGKTVLNPPRVSALCKSKFATSTHLVAKNVPCIPSLLAFSLDQAIEAVDRLGGYPVVVKPDSGSWGRLISRVNDRDALEAVIEHKHTLGGPQHGAILIQPFVRKPGRDVRLFLTAEGAVAAVYRYSDHWITNTARNATTANCPVDEALQHIARQVIDALKNDGDPLILAVDLVEDPNAGYAVNEINHTMEFRNSESPTGVSISDSIIQYCVMLDPKAALVS